MAGINISFASDVRPFLKGTKDVGEGLEDVADALDDLTRDAQRKGKAIGDDLTKAGDEGQDAAKKLERKFRDAFDDVKKEAKQAGDKVGDDIKRGTDKASEGTDTLKQNAGANAKEVAASFDGSAASIADGFQGLAAEALEGFGPAGLIAGTAVAAGLGVAFTAFQEQSEAAKARISEMADWMIEANRRVLAEDFINEQLRMIYTNADDAAINVGNLKEAVEETGLTESTIARAFAGDQDARVVALEALRTKYAEASEDAVSLDNEVAASGVTRQAEIGRWLGDMERLGGEYDTAASRADGFRDAVAGAHKSADRNVGGTRAEYERLAGQINGLPNKTVSVAVDTDAAERALGDFVRRTRKVEIGVSFRGGQAVI